MIDIGIGISAYFLKVSISFIFNKLSSLFNKNKPERKYIKYIEKRTSAIIVGLGGTGKTSIINRLQSSIDKPKRTDNFNIYHLRYNFSNREDNISATYNIYISDYRGQNFGDIFRNLLHESKDKNSPMRYGFITSLIFVVDLFDEEQTTSTIYEYPNTKRIEEQVNMWSELAVDAIFGIVTQELKYCCLFINKYDLLEGPFDKKTIENYFDRLSSDIKRRLNGIKFEVIVGSATTGDTVNHLQNRLFDYSI